MENMCLHCLEEGNWTDEDKCPSCASKGHVSPWSVGSCQACYFEYKEKLKRLSFDIHSRQNLEAVICGMQERIRKLEETVAQLDRRLINTGTERIGGILS